MTTAVAIQHRSNGWFASYNGRPVRLVNGPNMHNLCHVVAPGFASYACLHQLHPACDELDMPIVDPDFDPNQKD